MTYGRRQALVPAAVVAFVLGGGMHAEAAIRGGITSPTDGSVVYAHATLGVVAELSRDSFVDGSPRTTLSIRVPGEDATRKLAESTTWSNDRQTLRFDLNTACPAYPGTSCVAPAANGAYQVLLTGSVSQTRSFTLRIPPAAPANVSARASGQNQITVSWAPNAEPDVAGYELYAGSGELVKAGISRDQTSYVVDFPETGYAGEHSFAVRARRTTCPGCAETLSGPLSAPASATLTEPEPSPEPSPGGDGGDGGNGGGGDGTGSGGNGSGGNGNGNGSGGGFDSGGGTGGEGSGSGSGSGTGGSGSGTGGSGSGTGTGGTGGGFSSGGGGSATRPDPVVNQRRSFGLTFKSFAPKLGQPKLPPLPQFAEVPEPEGTYDPFIDYGDQEISEETVEAQATGVRAVWEDVYSTAFEGRRLWTSLAAGLVLLLGAGHLRTFVAAPRD